MKTQIFEGSKEQIAQEVARIPGEVLRAVVYIAEPTDKRSFGAGEAGDPWTRAFRATLDNAVILGHDVNDTRESIYQGRGQ
jgi:hypothetical protein